MIQTIEEKPTVVKVMKMSDNRRRKPIFSLGRKNGRKGDPRMHRAVSAKLADPNMSLFHALKAGGFNYIDDIDAKAIDEESVTLAQRKNQLSRRLRMVKTSSDDHSEEEKHQLLQRNKGATTSQQTLDDLVEAQKATFQTLLRQSTEGSSIGSVDTSSSYHHPPRFVNHASTGSNAHHHGSDNDHHDTTFEPLDHYHVPMHEQQQQQQQQQHTAAPQKIGPSAAPAAPLFPSMIRRSTGGLIDDDEPPPPPLPLKPSNNRHMVAAATAASPPSAFAPPAASFLRRSSSGVPEPPCLASRMSSQRTITDAQTGHPLCSEFGLRSLNRTAQSVGLSLDQLALVLSSTENLAEKLGMVVEGGDNNDDQVAV